MLYEIKTIVYVAFFNQYYRFNICGHDDKRVSKFNQAIRFCL